MDKLIYYQQLIKTGYKQAFALKKVFILRVLFMILNNLMLLYAWHLMFLNFSTIHSWTFNDFMFMTGLVVLTFSIWPIFFRGIGIHLMRLIENGELDSFLVIPRHVLFSVGCSVCDPSGIGDFITGILLIFFSGLVSLSNLPMVFCFIFSGICVFLTINILISTLPFFIKNSSDIGERLFYMFFNIAGYPGSIYSGYLKLIFCTLLPVGFISILPVELMHNFSGTVFMFLIVASICFLSLSIFIFSYGLKKYESGNRFNIHH